MFFFFFSCVIQNAKAKLKQTKLQNASTKLSKAYEKKNQFEHQGEIESWRKRKINKALIVYVCNISVSFDLVFRTDIAFHVIFFINVSALFTDKEKIHHRLLKAG